MSRRRKSLFASPNVVNILAIAVTTVFCVCVVVLLAKSLFASNSSEVPVGLNTATISNPAMTTPPPATVSEEQTAPPTGTLVTSELPAAATTTTAPDSDELYVTKYVQLLTEPKEDAEHIVCMSPNIKVKVLERRADGYFKVTFINGDGSTCTGYVLGEFLSSTPVQRDPVQ